MPLKDPAAKAAYQKAYYARNRETQRAKQTIYQRERRDELYEANRVWRATRSQELAAYAKARRDADPERRRQIAKRTYEKNKDAAFARVLQRDVRIRRATPAWADRRLMTDLYIYARIIRAHGIDCHVDHSVPLQGKLVCGLHTPENLSVILASQNLKKNNSFEP